MNKDILMGKWKELRGEMLKAWGKLTDDELDVIAGERDVLAGKLQEKYGWEREQAHQEIDKLVGSAEKAGAEIKQDAEKQVKQVKKKAEKKAKEVKKDAQKKIDEVKKDIDNKI